MRPSIFSYKTYIVSDALKQKLINKKGKKKLTTTLDPSWPYCQFTEVNPQEFVLFEILSERSGIL